MRTFSAHETAWLQQLDGIELPPFWHRAVAFDIDLNIDIAIVGSPEP